MKKNEWLVQELLGFRLYREGDIRTIELAFTSKWRHHLSHVKLICKDVSSVQINELESHADASGMITIDSASDRNEGKNFFIEEWEDQTFSFYCRQYEAAEEKMF